MNPSPASQAPNLVLTGFMGTGKTTVGRLVAARLGLELVDTDAWIEQETGRVIADIFAEDGEAFFRGLERRAVETLCARRGLVITGGGGIVLDPKNVRAFVASGILVCLQARPDVVLARVAAQDHRPLLEGGEKAEKIRRLLASRQAVYDALPNQVDTSDCSIEQVADRVVELYQTGSGGLSTA